MVTALNREKGFTLIEIVLVLAIAAFIIALVFAALSGAQKSKRDTQRREDGSAFVAALESYSSNHTGAYPAGGIFAAGSGTSPVGPAYFTRTDPLSGQSYAFTATPATAPAAGTIAYNTTYSCSGQVGVAGAGARAYAIVVGLEVGGSVCFSNK